MLLRANIQLTLMEVTFIATIRHNIAYLLQVVDKCDGFVSRDLVS